MTADRTDFSHDDIRSLLGAYAIHAVDDHERDAVESHLTGCVPCADEVARLVEASAVMGLVDLEEPAPELWSRILTDMRADDVASGPASTARADTPAGSAAGSGSAASKGGSATLRDVAPVIALDAAREVRRHRRSRLRLAIGSAAAAAAVVVPITASITAGGGSAPSLAALADQARDQSGTRAVELRDGDGGRVGEVILTGAGVGYLRSESLPALPDGSTYQLWAIIDGTPVSAGLLGRSPNTSAFTVTTEIEAIAVSVERRQGASAPTSTPVAVATLA